MKHQKLIIAFILLSVSGPLGMNLAGAVNPSGIDTKGLNPSINLPGLGFYGLSEDDIAAYKQGELLVYFVEMDAYGSLPDGPVIIGPWRPQAIRRAVSDFILAGSEVGREYGDAASGLVVIKLPAGMTVADAFIRFNLSANVLYAEPNYKYKLLITPNDPQFSEMWGLNNTGQTGGIEDADIDAPEAWDISIGSPDVIVAVADTGIDYTHPDLEENMWMNVSEVNGQTDVDDDGNGYIDDVYGYDFAGANANDPSDGDSEPNDNYFHGTHVAGTIGAIGNNNEGITGVCWAVKLMALKVFSDDYVLEPEVFVSDAVEAIGYAVDNGASIINASWGGTFYSQSLYDAIKDAGDAGLLFVTAAGNDYGKDIDLDPIYPASFDLGNIISVMATDHNDEMSIFSNFGARSVDIAEPGTDIISTSPTYETDPMLLYNVSTDYATLSGTSTAAPHVSGTCALLLSHYPVLPRQLIKGILLKSVDSILGPQYCLSCGRVNLYNALTVAPSGKAGKVLNSKDDPDDLSHLYSSIQAAIDDANDGDVLIAESSAVFHESIDFKGKAITVRSGNISDPNDPSISPEDTYIYLLDEGSVVTFQSGEGSDSILQGFTISWGSADYGGGIRCDGSSPTITDCIISNNFADHYGGGIDCVDGTPSITNCTIVGNRTSSNSGIGGGVSLERSSAMISNCFISNNFSDNVGGGIACYYSNPTIFNCIISNNSAIYQGGGIDLDNSSPTISSCTIVVDSNLPKDGGIFALHDSSPIITNCILWGNGDDLYGCLAAYSCIEDDDDSGMGNIHSSPAFMRGPLGDYYLRQTAAGQLSDSPCVNAGDPNTDISFGIDSYTTRTDGVADADVVDIGVHYRALGADSVRLDVIAVIDGGPVEPDLASDYIVPGSGNYRQYEVVQFQAYPPEGYRVKAWLGTDDDLSTETNNTLTIISGTNAIVVVEFEKIPLYRLRTEVISGRGAILPYHRRGEYYPDGTVVTLIASPDPAYIVGRWAGSDDDTSWSNANTVTMDSDKEVTVLFRQPKSLHVPGQYQDINSAIYAAYDHGDKIIVSKDRYYPPEPNGYDFIGKAITIASEHPEDPCCVANTIIEVRNGPAFMFQNGEGSGAIVDGFTIQGQGDLGPIAPPDTGGTGVGGDPNIGFGGAITCLNGSSPTLSHLIIKDCVARGQDGEDGTFIFDSPDDPEDPLDALDPLDPLPDPDVPDPNDPNMWAPADPNGPELPDDPNSPVDGFAGQPGEDGLPGEPGMDGLDGERGYDGGSASGGYGGAMYFDANSAPTILYCTIINCQAIGGDGGFGGIGQDGQDGQDGQPGQEGQEGQVGGEGLNDGAEGAGGAGGNGGDGGPGGNGGRAGDGGIGGDGGEALGGAIFFGANCRPTIQYCKILNCTTRPGMGNYGGDGGAGGNGGVGAETADGGDGGDGEPDGEEGVEGMDGPGGNGGDGGNGGGMGANGAKSWAGAIYYSENCEVEISNTVISYNATITDIPTFAYIGGDGGNGGDGGDGEGDAVGGNGGMGGIGGDGGPGDDDPGTGGIGGVGGADGEDGEDGSDGVVLGEATVTNYGGANYYELGCKVKLTDCTISYNTTKQDDESGDDGGGEDYKDECEVVLNRCEFIGNSTGDNGDGGGQCFDGSCVVEINDCNYVNNSSSFDGGGLYCLYDCALEINDSRFVDNSALGNYGCGGGVYGGGVLDPDPSSSTFGKWYHGGTITINNSYFTGNEAPFGGGLYWHGDGAEVSISESVFNKNIADHGGGMYWSSGTAKITGCSVMGNKARGRISPNGAGIFSGGGGGLFCWSSEAKIENCFISENSAFDSGGGVCFGGDTGNPTLRNCLVKGNSAVLDGGGIVSYWLITPTISNCTIVDNTAYDAHNATNGRGGGLSCSYESQTTLIDSILWGNTGSNGNQIAIGSNSEPYYINRPSALTVSYCDIQGGRSSEAVYVEHGGVLNWLEGNINSDPLFVKSDYYLSQGGSGQDVNSPCVDAGSDLAVAVGLDEYSTRPDGIGDTGTVDMGLHYPTNERQYQLTVNVVGEHGTVKPSSGFFNKYSVVTLTATVDTGYRVRWIGTNDDLSSTLTNTVTMYSDRTVTVVIEQPATIKVPGDYTSIRDAYEAAGDGDVIIVNKGRYRGSGIEITGKAITITSSNPDDPASVAETIIDSEGYLGNVISFSSNCGPDTVLNGLTITNVNLYKVDQEAPTGAGDDGEDGFDIAGGGIYIESGASPTIVNCIVTNCQILAGNPGSGNAGAAQGDLSDVNDPNSQPLGFGGKGGDGGDGGSAYGGGIYCGSYSSPSIINCTISDCQIEGADGGDGADGGAGSDNGVAGLGGNGGDGGNTYGGGIYVGYGSTPTIRDCNIVNCSAFGGDGGIAGNGGDAPGTLSTGGNGGIGGDNSRAYGGGIYFAGENIATVSNCQIIGCLAAAGNAGDGGNFGGGDTDGVGGFGGGHLKGEYWKYSACGGGVYCGKDSRIVFEGCTINDNSIAGGMSGVAGATPPEDDIDDQPGPVAGYVIPSYGAGVFCESESLPVFRGCDISGNTAQDVNDPNGLPAYRLSPYISYGGGICSIDVDSALVSDCNFTDNFATLGGGLYWDNVETVVSDCNFVENIAFKGGGIYCIESINSTIRGCEFRLNQANGPGGEGGAIYCSSMPAEITDCEIQHNIAFASGGGVYLSGGASESRILANCLITDNYAGGDGGGISSNWYADPIISNCTFVRNAATGNFGEPNHTGFGGGLYCSYESSSVVNDSIFWDNYALKGNELGVGSGLGSNPRCGVLVVSYSDVKASENSVWVGEGCVLEWKDGNIDSNPQFVSGPFGDYYLAQNSLCVDSGSTYSGLIGLIGYTTRIDEAADTGKVDMGFHYPMAEPCKFCDLAYDGVITFHDFALLAERWLDEGCSASNLWCQGADITVDTRVDFRDIAFLADCWLAEDSSAPVPNPSRWETEPYLSGASVSMAAEISIDAWGWDVEYYFECIYGNGHDSGWQSSPTYTDAGLANSAEYGYRVKARDTRPYDKYLFSVESDFQSSLDGGIISQGLQQKFDDTQIPLTPDAAILVEEPGIRWLIIDHWKQYVIRKEQDRLTIGYLYPNETQWSEIRYVSGVDNTPPAPAPTWLLEPYAVSPTSVSMSATTAYDANSVEYYFENTSGNGHDSGWQDSTSYTDPNLNPDTEYSYRVKARDTSPARNETVWSEEAFVTTSVSADMDAPTPNPMEWDLTADSNGVDGTPHEIWIGPDEKWGYGAAMTAVAAVDAGGGPVEYFFECTTRSDFSSDWIPNPTYTVMLGQSGLGHRFRVKARDQFYNETAWSTEERAD